MGILSSIVPLCIEMGFDFQYAKSGMLVMTNWSELDQSRP